MILQVRPSRNREKLQKIVHEITLGVLCGDKVENAARQDVVSAGVLAFDGNREKPLEILNQFQALFPGMKPDNPLMAEITKSRERLVTFPGWGALKDVEAAPEASASFPVDAFPEPFRSYIQNAAAHIQIDPGAVGAAVLAASAGAAQHRFTVAHPSGNGHYEHLCLFIAIVADPGERKSGASKVGRCLLEPFIDSQAAAFKAKNADYQAQRDTLKAQKQGVLNALSSPRQRTDTENAELPKSVKSYEQQLEMLAPPPDPRFIVSGNTTPEGLAEHLQRTNGNALIYDDEPEIFSILRGAYAKPGTNPIIDIFLNGYDGSRYELHRAGGRIISLDGIAISLCIFAQEKPFREFITDPELAGRGMVPRFQSVFLRRTIANERSKTPLDEGLKSQCIERLTQILNAPFANDPPAIEWTDEAREIALEYGQEIQNTRGSSMTESGDSSYAAKQPGACYRMAAILHLLAEGTEANDGISRKTAENAVKLHKFFWNSRNAQKQLATRTTAQQYQAILDAVLSLTFDAETMRGSCTRSEVWRECRAKHRAIFGSDSEARVRFYEEFVPELCALGYLDAEQKRGQTATIYLNPACIDLKSE